MMPFVCKIDMDKKGGVLVEVVNAEGMTTQSMYMDGLKITTTVKGPALTSTIVQDEASVTVTAQRFVVDATTIECRAKASATYTSGAETSILAGAALSATAGAALSLSAGAEASLEAGAACTVGGGGDLTLTGGGAAQLLGGGDVCVVGGGALQLAGTGDATLAGATMNLAGADINVEGPCFIPILIPW
jgi:hypothetical protein